MTKQNCHDRPILTEPEAADFVRLGLTKLRELRRDRKIPYIPGKPIRYLRGSLLRWMAEQEVQVSTLIPAKTTRSTDYKTNMDKAALRAGILT